MSYWIHDAFSLGVAIEPDWGKAETVEDYADDLQARLRLLRIPFLDLAGDAKALLLAKPFAPVRITQRQYLDLRDACSLRFTSCDPELLFFSFLPECTFTLEQKGDPWGRRAMWSRRPL